MRRKKEVAKVKKIWEDICFRCYEDGELLMCDWKNCPKVYHLACLGRDKMPGEKWFCPWHHCAECGKAAVRFCIHCPNAYCKKHDSILMEHKELGVICDEHEDDVEDLLAFYRQIVGGVSTRVNNPNIPQGKSVPQLLSEKGVKETGSGSQIAGQIEELVAEEDEEETEEVEEMSVYETETDTEFDSDDDEAKTDEDEMAASSGKGYPCSQCATSGHTFALEKHLVNIHGFSENKAKTEVRRIILGKGGDPDPPTKTDDDKTDVGSRLTSDSKDFSCPEPDCGWTGTRRQRLYRHLTNIHHFSEERTNRETERSVIKVNQARAQRTAEIRLKAAVGSSRPMPLAQMLARRAKENVPTHILTGKKLEVLLLCPVCKWAMRGSNLYRHISIKHPEVDIGKIEPERVEPKRAKEKL